MRRALRQSKPPNASYKLHALELEGAKCPNAEIKASGTVHVFDGAASWAAVNATMLSRQHWHT